MMKTIVLIQKQHALLFFKNLNILDYDYYFQTIDLVLQNNSAGIFLLLDSILRKGFDPLLYVNGLSSHIRDLMMCKDPQTVELLEVGESHSVEPLSL